MKENTQTIDGPLPNKQSALELIENLIDAWKQEGQAHKKDKLGPANEQEWTRLLENYFVCDEYRCTSVNASNLCPSLRQVDEMTSTIQRLLENDISFMLRHDLAEASLKYGLNEIKSWIGLGSSNVDPQSLISLTRNTTEGNNIINNGLVFWDSFNKSTDNVVCWEANHPTNYDAWYYRQKTQNWNTSSLGVKKINTDMLTQIPSSKISIPTDPSNAGVIRDAINNTIDSKTRVVTLSWQSNETGMLLPMAELVDVIRDKEKKNGYPIHIHADSAQTFGLLDLKLDEIGVDSITGSFHKWPCGPKMVGILYMNPKTKAAERFVANTWGYDEYIMTPTDYFSHKPTDPQIDSNTKRFSYLGQQNDATLVATWITALFHNGKFHPNVNPGVIERRVKHLGDYAKNELCEQLPKKFPFYNKELYKWILTPTTDKNLRTSIFIFVPPDGVKAPDVTKHVYDQHGYAIANLNVQGQQVLRIAPTICNTTKDIENVIEAIVDVMSAIQKGTLPSAIHDRSYA